MAKARLRLRLRHPQLSWVVIRLAEADEVPSVVDEHQLGELHIKLIEKPKSEQPE